MTDKPSARELLAAAHRCMSASVIAAHALDLAHEVGNTRRTVTSLCDMVNNAACAVADLQAVLAAQLDLTYRVHALFEAGDDRAAKRLLSQAATVVFEREPIALLDRPIWSHEIFQPKEA